MVTLHSDRKGCLRPLNFIKDATGTETLVPKVLKLILCGSQEPLTADAGNNRREEGGC